MFGILSLLIVACLKSILSLLCIYRCCNVSQDKYSSKFVMFVLFASCLSLPVPLATHRSAEKRRLGDCALGEGMYSQWATSGESLSGGRASCLPRWTSLTLHFYFRVDRFCRRRLQGRSHTQSDTCWAPSVTSSSLQPLINPAFPCGRSLRRRCWKKK